MIKCGNIETHLGISYRHRKQTPLPLKQYTIMLFPNACLKSKSLSNKTPATLHLLHIFHIEIIRQFRQTLLSLLLTTLLPTKQLLRLVQQSTLLLRLVIGNGAITTFSLGCFEFFLRGLEDVTSASSSDVLFIC